MAGRIPLESIARLHELLEAGSSVPAAAAALGADFHALNYWARRIRRGIPWAEPLAAYSCIECGGPGLGRRDRRVHERCRPPRKAAGMRRSRRG